MGRARARFFGAARRRQEAIFIQVWGILAVCGLAAGDAVSHASHAEHMLFVYGPSRTHRRRRASIPPRTAAFHTHAGAWRRRARRRTCSTKLRQTATLDFTVVESPLRCPKRKRKASDVRAVPLHPDAASAAVEPRPYAVAAAGAAGSGRRLLQTTARATAVHSY